MMECLKMSSQVIQELEEIDDLHELPKVEGKINGHMILRRRKSLPDATEKRRRSGENEFEIYKAEQIATNLINTSNNLGRPQRRCLYRAASSSKVQYAMIRAAIANDNRFELQTLLRRRDVRINEIEGDGLAAIHFAAMYGTHKTMNVLINEGAKINFPTEDGEYPLDIAVCSGNFEIAQFLIEKGARLDHVVNGTPTNEDHAHARRCQLEKMYEVLPKS